LRGLIKTVALSGVATIAFATVSAEARITRIEIAKTEPAFAGQSFGAIGAYERLTGKAYGEVDPAAPGNAIIQDIALAPHNSRGMVEYVTDIDILRPADRSKGNGVLFFNIVNRGNKGGLWLFNADVPINVAANNDLAAAGDGFMRRQGYTLVWFGWQGDVAPGNNRMTIKVPVARKADGSPITGIVRSRLTTPANTIPEPQLTTLNLSSSYLTGLAHTAYPTVRADNPHAARGRISSATHDARARTRAPGGDPEQRLVVRRLRARQAGDGQREPDLLSRRVQAGAPL
jgi:hypothetical protein